jgi:hypothetical protein
MTYEHEPDANVKANKKAVGRKEINDANSDLFLNVTTITTTILSYH